MRRLIAILASLAATHSLASTPIDEAIDAAGARTLDISNVAGRVSVSGGSGDEVRVTGTLSDAATGLEVRRDGSRIVVHVLYPQDNRGNWRDNEGTVLEIEAPASLDVETRTVSASIILEGIEGEQELETVSGRIETDLFDTEIRARSVSGRIRINGRDESTRADIASVSGRVELDAVGGEIEAQTVSGSIDLVSGALERAELKAVSGSITVTASLSSDARLRTTTTSGSIDLNLEGSPAGRYELSSFSGSIDSCIGPAPSRPQFGPPTSALRFEEPDADMQVYANSMSGSIDLCR